MASLQAQTYGRRHGPRYTVLGPGCLELACLRLGEGCCQTRARDGCPVERTKVPDNALIVRRACWAVDAEEGERNG